MKRPRLLEKQIERQIVDLLEAHKWIVLKTNKFAGCGQVLVQGSLELGIPDLQVRQPYQSYVLTDLQRVVWIEVKRPGEECSDVQKTWHLLAKKRGEIVIVVELVEDVAKYFDIKMEALK